MGFYLVPIERVPTVFFAHRYSTGMGGWKFGNGMERLLEVTYIQKGALEISDGERVSVVPEGSIRCLCHAKRLMIRSLSEEHVHYTVAMVAEGLCFSERADFTAGACLAESIPADGGSMLSVIADDIMRLSSALPEDRVKTAALVMRLLSHMNDAARAAVSAENPLCRRAKQYIGAHLEVDISPMEIAAALGVSYGHLSRVFKAQEGVTLVGYITRTRLEYVRELLMLRRMTLEEAGLVAGFADVKYLSRRFHREYGITAREYIRSLK